MSHDVVRHLAAAIERGEPVVLATVVRTDRSVPRRAGTKMLVWADGRMRGTVGGGEMEARVRAEAAEALADGRPRLLTFDLVDPSSGDPGVCGGTAEIYLEPHMPEPLLFVVGAGHVGRAVAELARWVGYRTVVWDDRAEAIDELLATDGIEVEAAITGPIADALAAHPLDARSAVVMVTRNVALDVDLLPPLLATGAGYVGLMGSNRRWSTTRAKLVEGGLAGGGLAESGTDLTEADLDRVVSPIGVEIAAETPEEIALSILAQVVAHHRGG